ncbi:MAG TPA: type II toxin-antitoxin system VapC family toxin [Candidatus Acidoferrales bacterium]|nr:type II toxin-antitoxin system VapC family toxin [Candidatus Acidoferrales bacterium]
MMVVDANSIVKLAIMEENSEAAFKAIGAETSRREPILAPDIVMAEALNALWVNFAKKKRITAEQLDQAEAAVVAVIEELRIIPTIELESVAMRISRDHGLTVYDSLYAAAGLMNDVPLLTFDEKIRNKAKAIGIALVEYE